MEKQGTYKSALRGAANLRTRVTAALACAALGLLFLAAGCTLSMEDGGTRVYGLLIGINDYADPTVPDLTYCEADATGIRDSLAAHGWDGAELADGDLGNGELLLRLSAQAGKSAIVADIQSVLGSARDGDYVFVFYSGHGWYIPDTNGDEEDGYDEVIVPRDYLPGDYSTLLVDDELRDLFARSRTEKGAIVFDSCNSGGMINQALRTSIGTGLGSGLSVTGAASRSLGSRGLGGSGATGDLDVLNFPVLAAAGQSEESWEVGGLGHGVFSYFLIDGIQNLKADRNRDDLVSVREWFEYAQTNTESFTSRFFVSQHPQLRFSRDFLDILVTR